MKKRPLVAVVLLLCHRAARDRAHPGGRRLYNIFRDVAGGEAVR
jgi:hypothetical protein